MAINPKNTYTVENFIDAGASITLTYNNLSFIESINNGTIQCPIFNVIDDYMYELKRLAVDIEFSDSEYQKYIYKPKLLAHDIYKNPELFFVILLINGICDVKEFNKRKIKLISPTNLNEALTYIYNAEKNMIERYNED